MGKISRYAHTGVRTLIFILMLLYMAASGGALLGSFLGYTSFNAGWGIIYAQLFAIPIGVASWALGRDTLGKSLIGLLATIVAHGFTGIIFGLRIDRQVSCLWFFIGLPVFIYLTVFVIEAAKKPFQIAKGNEVGKP